MLSFFLVAEALTGLIYHRPTSEFQLLVSHTLPDDERSISRNVAEKRYDSRHDKLRKQYLPDFVKYVIREYEMDGSTQIKLVSIILQSFD